MSPNQHAWARFKRNRIGHVSLWAFLVLLVLATFAELLSNDKPLLAHINGQWHAPLFNNPSERKLGDFNEYQVGDIIECYQLEQVAQKL